MSIHKSLKSYPLKIDIEVLENVGTHEKSYVTKKMG